MSNTNNNVLDHYTQVLSGSTVVDIKHELQLMRDAYEALMKLVGDYVYETDPYELSELDCRIRCASEIYKTAKSRLQDLAPRFGYQL